MDNEEAQREIYLARTNARQVLDKSRRAELSDDEDADYGPDDVAMWQRLSISLVCISSVIMCEM